MSTLLLLLFSCVLYKSVGGSYLETIVLKFNFNVTVLNNNSNCSRPEGSVVTLRISSNVSMPQVPDPFVFNISAATSEQTVNFVIRDTDQNLLFYWTHTSACCPVTIINGTINSNRDDATLIICNEMSLLTSSTSVKFVGHRNRLFPSDPEGCRDVVNTSLPTCMMAASISPSLSDSSSTVNVYASLLDTSTSLPESSISSVPMYTSTSLPESSISTVPMYTSISIPESSISSVPMYTSISIPESSVPMSTSISLLESSISTVPMSTVIPTLSMHTSVSSLRSRSTTQVSSLAAISMTTTSFFATISSLATPSPSPSPSMNCPETNQWESTKPRHWANGTCHKGTFNATRYCDLNGSWGQINCSASEQFKEIMSKINISNYAALEALSEQLNDFSAAQTIVLLDIIITNSIMESNNETVQIVLDIANEIIRNASNKMDGVSIVSQLLMTLDNSALNVRQDLSLSTDKIFLNVKQIQDFPDEELTAIDYNGNTLMLPVEILNAVPATVASFVYKNLSALSPTNNSELVSPVISSTVSCNGTCNISDLKKPVTISFNLSDVQQSFSSRIISCVFWNFNNTSNDSLPTGYWDKGGCTDDVSPINGSTVTCQCNHLTHFAILLSPRSDETSPVHTKILTIAGQILVPISLVCMLLVILTYTCLKSLWGMRNYIHIMLCSNLFVSQLLFLVGIEQTKHQSVCSGIAVVLQYMFLVSFMWMLMEGVVLYVTLVKVFIKYPKHYIIGFTLISYGVPAIYMMIIVPIGFLVNSSDQSHYLYYNDGRPTACWLNYESHFIWSFIGPVILIIIANIGFFVMSIFIMRNHQKKKIHNKETSQIKHWIKASLSLTIIMGIGWIGNVLFFSKELIFIAYIMTVFIAGQGIIIFILYVPLSSHVREAYGKWWRKKRANSLVLSKITFLTSNDSTIRDSKNRKYLTENIYDNYTMGTYEGDDKFKDKTIISNSTFMGTLPKT